MKKLICLLGVVILLFTLYACGSVEIGSEKSKDESTSSSEDTVFETPCSWEVGEFLDEFNQPTGEKFILTQTTDGKFTNSATSNSRLSAAVQVLNDGVDIFLYEYGDSCVKGVFDETYYNISILDEAGTKHSFRGIMYEGNDRVNVTSNKSEMLSLLKSGEKLKIYIEEDSENYNSKYLFNVDTTGFADLYSKTF